MVKLLAAAHKYLDMSISVVATDENKRAIFPWKKYQHELPTKDVLKSQFAHDKALGIAVICGQVSMNLEVIDIDLKYDVSGDLYQRLTEHNPALVAKLWIVRTKSNGYHLYYRCEVIEGNQKLAQRYTTEEERRHNPNEKVKVLIETRGEGGYVIGPPTEGYKRMSTVEDIPVLTLDERDQLLSICRSFNEVVEQVNFNHSTTNVVEKYATTPWEDYNQRGDILQLLERYGWKVMDRRGERILLRRPGKDEGSSGDYHTGLGLFKVFTTSTEFEAGKGYKPSAVFAMLECGNDFRIAARKLAEAGYGAKVGNYSYKLEQEVYRRRKDGQPKEEIIKAIAKQEGLSDEQTLEAVDNLEKSWGPDISEFWDVTDKGAIRINRRKLEQFLSNQGGFYLYFYDKNSTIYRLVRVRDMFVEEVSTEQIKKFIKGYVESLPEKFDNGKTPSDLLEVIYKGSDAYFNKSFLEFIDRIDLDILRDTKEAAYFPFINGVVEVRKGGITLKAYGEIGKHIWRSQVIDFRIDIMNGLDFTLVEYMRFIDCICNKEEDRREYALSIIGYMLHKYKDPERPFAVILAEETDNESKGGGTGKGIFIKALSYILKTVRVDGKNWKMDKSFALQRVSLDTQLIVIEDCRKDIDFESFYSNITEGTTVEKKNQQELYVDYEDSAKFAFTTNFFINLVGAHARRRAKVFEFSNFFSPEHTPREEFGHLIFKDWDNDEWNRFYNLLFVCVQVYMENGILEVRTSEKIKLKQIKINYGEEFLEWFDEYSKNGCGEWKLFRDMYGRFTGSYDFDKKDYSQKRFKKAIQEASDLFGYDLQKQMNNQSGKLPEYRMICG
jgi:hypothetical protein